VEVAEREVAHGLLDLFANATRDEIARARVEGALEHYDIVFELGDYDTRVHRRYIDLEDVRR
jgi:hypothetical protein